ncbi:hypothetical protein ACROYT_G039216 [Oculina patagonica]
MRTTLSHLCRVCDDLSVSITDTRSELRRVCANVDERDLYNRISHLIHIVNSDWFQYLKLIKDRKLQKLTANATNLTRHQEVVDGNDSMTVENLTIKTIPDSLNLSEAEKSVLQKGLNFIPTKPKTDEFTTKEDCEKFFRRLRLKAFFHDKDHESNGSLDAPSEDVIFDQLKPKQSTWIPPSGKFSALDHYFQHCQTEINQIDFNQPVSVKNLSKEEQDALKSLHNRTDIVIEPADKGGAVVVWDRDLYQEEAMKQLSDERFYQQIDQEIVEAQHKEVTSTISHAISTCDLPPKAKNLNVDHPRTSKFYMLPKIHKAGNPGRPIVSACSCPTSNISAYLDSVIAPLVKQLPTYVKDTSHALQMLDSFTFSGPNRYLFTMDIKSLYTQPPTDTLVRLAELVPSLNTFDFGGTHYQQVGGVAMGTKMGPNYACLFVGYVEQKMFADYHGQKPELYKRYIDDVLGASSGTREDLESFIEFCSSYHPSLKYTFEISESSIPFLDLSLSISNDRISTSIHYKPTDTHNYLHYSSSHPTQCKNGIPFGQFLRLRRICSNDSDFDIKSNVIILCKERLSTGRHYQQPEASQKYQP